MGTRGSNTLLGSTTGELPSDPRVVVVVKIGDAAFEIVEASKEEKADLNVLHPVPILVRNSDRTRGHRHVRVPSF